MALYVAWKAGQTVLKVLTRESGLAYISEQAAHLRDRLTVIETRNSRKEVNDT